MNRPSLLNANGLPFVIDRFELDGRKPSLEGFIDADRDGTPVEIDRSVAAGFLRSGLSDLDVVSFAGRQRHRGATSGLCLEALGRPRRWTGPRARRRRRSAGTL